MRKNIAITILWFIFSVFIITGCRSNSIPLKTVTASPVKDYVFVTKWKWPGNSSLYYESNNTTLDLEGNMYIITSDRTIQKFNSQGMFITEWICKDTGKEKVTNEVVVIATDNQNIYVLAYKLTYFDGSTYGDNYIIKKYDLNGNFITSWDLICGDGYIALDKEKNVHLIMGGGWGNSMVIYDSNGKFKAGYENITDSLRNIPGYPKGLIVKGGEIFSSKFIEPENTDILKKIHSKFPQLSNIAPELYFSRYHPIIFDVKIDSLGYSYFLFLCTNSGQEGQYDYGSCIAKYDSSGKFIKQWGGEFVNGHCTTKTEWRSIGIDSEDNIYVADSANYCIQKFDSNGNFITKWPVKDDSDKTGYDWPDYVAIDLKGNVYVGAGPYIMKYAPKYNSQLAMSHNMR